MRFSQFTSMPTLIEERLVAAEIACVNITGRSATEPHR